MRRIVVIRTKRELQIARAHLRRKRLKLWNERLQRWTMPVLWLFLLAGLYALGYYVYWLPAVRLANDSFGLPLTANMDFEEAKAALTERYGEPVPAPSTEDAVNDRVVFPGESQDIYFFNTDWAEWVARVLPPREHAIGYGEHPYATDAGITFGATAADVMRAYGSFGFYGSAKSWTIYRGEALSEGVYTYTIADGRCFSAVFTFRDCRLFSVYLRSHRHSTSYPQRVIGRSSLGNAALAAFIEDVLLLTCVVLPAIMLYAIMSVNWAGVATQWWKKALFGLVPWAAFFSYLWILSIEGVGPQGYSLALMTTPLAIGYYLFQPLTAYVGDQGGDIFDARGKGPFLRLIIRMLNFSFAGAMSVDSFVAMSVLALIVAILVAFTSFWFAILLVSLMPV
jgi:hypothetical protein